MRLLVPDGARRQRLLQCEAHLPLPPASPPPPAPASPAPAAAGGRTVVVGIRRDAASRELLTWALVKVASSIFLSNAFDVWAPQLFCFLILTTTDPIHHP
jgi:hypothetical protein